MENDVKECEKDLVYTLLEAVQIIAETDPAKTPAHIERIQSALKEKTPPAPPDSVKR